MYLLTHPSFFLKEIKFDLLVITQLYTEAADGPVVLLRQGTQISSAPHRD